MSGALEHLNVDHEAVLKYLGLNPKSPADQALVLVGQRYDLDPLLGQLCLIQGKLFITERGLWSIAHRSGQLDGVELVEQAVDGDEYVVKVKVHRKDMAFPFPAEGRFPTAKKGTAGKRMARKSAYSEALRMAFDVALPSVPMGWNEDEPVAQPIQATVLPSQPQQRPAPVGHTQAPPPDLPGEGQLQLTPAQRLAVVGKQAGLDDELRHRLIAHLTNGQASSAKDLDPILAGRFRRIVGTMRRDPAVLDEITDEQLRADLLAVTA